MATLTSFHLETTAQGGMWGYEGIIAPDAADHVFLKQLVAQDVHFYVSLPDDKEAAGVYALLDTLKASYDSVILTGERGVLSYDLARHNPAPIAYEGPYDDPIPLRTALPYSPTSKCYFIGTQTFLRLIKKAYFHDRT